MDSSTLNIILSAIGGLGGLFGVFGFFRSIRKPRARLRFANGKRKIKFTPHYFRAVATKYYVDPPTDCYDSCNYRELLKCYNKINEGKNKFCLPFCLTNTGKILLEDYRVEIKIRGGKYAFVGQSFTDGVNLNKKKSLIEYSPVGCIYLNPKDNVNFSFQFTPDPDVLQYELHWRIIAKDCNKSGKLFINFAPTIEEFDEIHYVNCQRNIPEGAEVIKDLKPYILALAEKMNLENKK
jgi:hypothetical protein